jgi:hypothetical protein
MESTFVFGFTSLTSTSTDYLNNHHRTACSKTKESTMALETLFLALLTVLVRAASLIREAPCDACAMLKASYPHITFYRGHAAYEFETRTREASVPCSRSHDC